MRQIILITLGLVVMTGKLLATEDESPQTESPSWTVDDVLSVQWASNFKISPDCHWAVWTKGVPDKDENGWVDNLFLSSLNEKREIQLTRGNDGVSSPKWSPDGQLVAFLSSRPVPKVKPDEKAHSQIWLLNPLGGEPWALTQGERAVSGFDWAGSNSIIYSAQEEPSLYEQIGKEKKETSQVVEDEAHEPPVRLFRIEVKSKKAIRLTQNKDRIGSFSVSPDGTRVITFHDRSLRDSYDQSLKPVIFLTDLGTGERKQVFEEPVFHIWRVCWQRDSQGFYAVNALSSNPRYSYPSILELYRCTAAAGAIEKVNLQWEKGLSSAATLEATEHGFITQLADGVRPKCARYSRVGEGWQREWLTVIHATNLVDFQVGKDDKTLLYDYSSPAHPDQWYRASLNGAEIATPVQLTDLNPQFQTKAKAKSEIVRYEGALAETVEGLLYYPHGYKSGKKYPLVVEIHGGPAALFTDRWDGFPVYNHDLLNARNAFVFRPKTLEEELAWFDKYLFQNAKETTVDLKPDAPLAIALKLKAAKSDGVRYGLLKNGKLIPETVKHGQVDCGQFEVTRAQFAEFDKGCEIEPGHANFPVNGIAFEQAKAYCAWLSKLTGDAYRLPGPSDAESLYALPAGPENTLDYWAGGAINPDDAAKLQAKIGELGGHAPLLKEVGNFIGSGSEEPVFDLGGNVAEWTITSDGSGRVMGASADTPADEKTRTRQPAAEYVGFRVVKGEPL